ncbi:hypothetical protein [Spirosoma aureum]|uniref:hypothetical protein n=1 Tax=Spirosoma aureum TaxID=2692134 RepID=UPI0018D791C5|nr:hypothetical protein [Spirosoma aureum]
MQITEYFQADGLINTTYAKGLKTRIDNEFVDGSIDAPIVGSIELNGQFGLLARSLSQ